MNPSQHIVFAGGGTAGHLFPGLAVAESLARARLPLRITFAGTGKAFEADRVTDAGFEYLALRCRPFPSGPREAFRFLADNLSGYYAAKRFLREQEVSLVVGLGGYASAATARATAAAHVPYVLVEQNAFPGKATRWLAPRAALVCAAFAEVRSHLRPGSRIRVTGTPVRREFLKGRQLAAKSPAAGRRRLIVLGGSGGARALNEHVPWAVYKARDALAGWEIVHQTGDRETHQTAALYDKLGMEARVAPFFDDLPRLLSTSDLAVSRAGGSTLAELAVCGVPAILLPYPRATDDHQRKNADVFAAAAGARIVDSREVVGRLDNALAKVLAELATDDGSRRQMADHMARLARPDATRRVARSIAEMLVGGQVAAV